MTTLESLTAGPIVHRLGWSLIHSIWELALVALLLAGLLYILRRRSANIRYLVSCGTLMLALMLPAVTFWTMPAVDSLEGAGFTSLELAMPAAPVTGPIVPAHRMPAEGGLQQAKHVGVPGVLQQAEPWRGRVIRLLEASLGWFVTAWLAGIGVLSLRILCSWIKAQGLRRLQVESPPAQWSRKLLELADELGMNRSVQLLQSHLARVPTVVGHFRPVILLPVAALMGLAPQQIEAILAHELAHIRRHDYLVNLLQVLIETVLFYHPATWWISRRIRIERENCCDDMAIRLCGDRFGYIRALVSLEELRDVPTPQLAVAWQGASLLDRVRRLLGVPAPQTLQSGRWMAGPLVLAAALVITICTFASSWALDAGQPARKPVAAAASAPAPAPASRAAGSSLNDKVARIDINNARLDDIVRVFGEPKTYMWGNEKTGESQTYTRDNLPEIYVMDYGDGFRILMMEGQIQELRFERTSSYVWRGGLHVGSSLEDVLKVLGQPAKTLTGEKLSFAEDVLYKDIEGRKGNNYYARPDQGVRMFFANDKISELYLTRTQMTPEAVAFNADLQAKVAQIDINSATVDDVVRIFGEPKSYVWGDEQTGEMHTFTKDDLPRFYIMTYGDGFRVFMRDGQIQELRFEHKSPYVWRGGLRVGSSLQDVFNVIGEPTRTVVGEPMSDNDGVLYKDMEGRKGWGYYARPDKGVRMFFMHDKVIALYVTRTEQLAGEAASGDPDLQAKVAEVNINEARPADILRIFGQPSRYIWGNKTFKVDALPQMYIMEYPGRISVWIKDGYVEELRFGEGSDNGLNYVFKDRLRVGSGVDDVLAVMGEPDRIVEGQKLEFEDGVLYKDIQGRKGWNYYARHAQGVRVFMAGNKVSALYLTRSARPAEFTAFATRINEQMAKLDINTATYDDLIAAFGEPLSYSPPTATKDNLPASYAMNYPADMIIYMKGKNIAQIRFWNTPSYAYRGKVTVGTSEEEAFRVVGQPDEVVDGQPADKGKSGVLYRNSSKSEDAAGMSVYMRSDQGITLHLHGGKVFALLLGPTRPASPAK